jgi:hypothetical protein
MFIDTHLDHIASPHLFYSYPSVGQGVRRDVLTTVWTCLSPQTEARMGNFLIFVPVALALHHEPTEADISRAYTFGACQTLSIIGAGQLPERCSPLQWLWAAHRGDMGALTEPVLCQFLPDFVRVIHDLRGLNADTNACPVWLQSFWSSYVETVNVCS